MTVGQLRAAVTPGEYLGWQIYFARKNQRAELQSKTQAMGRR